MEGPTAPSVVTATEKAEPHPKHVFKDWTTSGSGYLVKEDLR